MYLCFLSSNSAVIFCGRNQKHLLYEKLGAVDHCRVTRKFKKFYLGCKTFDDQARSGRPKTVDYEANPANSTRRLSGEFSISQTSAVSHLHKLNKNIQSCQVYLILTKFCRIFDSPKIKQEINFSILYPFFCFFKEQRFLLLTTK